MIATYVKFTMHAFFVIFFFIQEHILIYSICNIYDMDQSSVVKLNLNEPRLPVKVQINNIIYGVQ